ncbi:MAG: rod shape-determining protein MreD [Eubacteriales bacterium]|nr:rod shape-determining protein MreD [Eubacteriales bacterium]MDY3332775.1 rod shape-determining protein MreD [Gallibacter sp.]
MKLYFVIPIYIFIFILQKTIFNVISISGITVNALLVLSMIFVYAFDEEYRDIAVSLVFALALDSIGSNYAGISAFSMLVVLLLILPVKTIFNNRSKRTTVLLIVLGTILYNLIYVAILDILGVVISYTYCLEMSLWQSILNIALGLLIYIPAIKIANRFVGRTQEERDDLI